jgi:ferritin-like metal-binding protein YciE
MFGEKAKGETCEGIKGLIEEGKDLLDEDAADAVRDAGLIASAQKVEHYEIAGYGTLRTWANLLGRQEAAQLLEFTLEEEKRADHKLTAIAERLNLRAASRVNG